MYFRLRYRRIVSLGRSSIAEPTGLDGSGLRSELGNAAKRAAIMQITRPAEHDPVFSPASTNDNQPAERLDEKALCALLGIASATATK